MADNFALGYDWYRSQMPMVDPEKHELAVEKTPSYFNTEAVPDRIHRMNSDILLLLVVRDPVTRLISDYAQILENRREKGLPSKSFDLQALHPNGSVNTK